MSTEEPSASENQNSPQLLNQWIEIQESLKKQLITDDRFSWKLPPICNGQTYEGAQDDRDSDRGKFLKYIGGADLSFSKADPSIACATLVVLDASTLEVVHEVSNTVELRVPYVPGFLAFREAPVLLELLEKLKNTALQLYPQVLMVDGNGLLHPRGFGLACHLGVLADLPTIGIGKNVSPFSYDVTRRMLASVLKNYCLCHSSNTLKVCYNNCQLHHVDGLTQHGVRQLLEANGDSCSDVFTLMGDSGSTLGAALRSTVGSLKPIFISVGHRISLASAIEIVKLSCRYRIPEPIRQADIRSRDCLRKHGLS
ncbi:hypothetical protein SASPL_153052 [Salvia splendens]|uniref:Endonuclease V n=1 Tax=Salvia splendens TaxID=180675 RepID=A0A8X8W4H2_SALSN|nr:hypothetical protein SASPL_153052 [Salvia splendens]